MAKNTSKPRGGLTAAKAHIKVITTNNPTKTPTIRLRTLSALVETPNRGLSVGFPNRE